MFNITNRSFYKKRSFVLKILTIFILFQIWTFTYKYTEQKPLTDDINIEPDYDNNNNNNNNNDWDGQLRAPGQYKIPDRPRPDMDMESIDIKYNNWGKETLPPKEEEADIKKEEEIKEEEPKEETQIKQQEQQIISEETNTLKKQVTFKSTLPKIQFDFEPEPQEYTIFRVKRQNKIKDAFLHGWGGYKQYAMGHDELKPKTNTTNDPFGGWGATLIDALSTMTIMGLDKEFEEALLEVEKMKFELDENIIVFEAIIRYLGGLLSAYELSDQKHDLLIQKALDLGNFLAPSFNAKTGLFPHQWNPKSPRDTGVLLADLSMHLELFTLSYHTKDWSFAKKAQKITNLLDNMKKDNGLHIPGLYPTGINIHTARFTDSKCRLGAMGDSWFEYLLKQYLLVDGTMPQYSKMYLESVDKMKEHIFTQIPDHDMILLPPFDTFSKNKDATMDHLACFVPGMLAIGSKTFNRPEDLDIAKGALESCTHMYRTSGTGLGAEMWLFNGGEDYNQITFKNTLDKLEEINQNKNTNLHYQIDYKLPPRPKRIDQFRVIDATYHLRPETLESLFILYRITGDQKYQEIGWEIFEAIEKHCKTQSGYASIHNVDQTDDMDRHEQNQMDSMESFLFAETFKYLYLLFSPPDVISLDQYVFNTEGHPLRRRYWRMKK
ncbi:unnamed protein product [Cunninghamella blakesleeana]